MTATETNAHDRAAIALSALGWVLADDARAQRFLSLTGVDPDGLRARLGDPSLHDAVLAFLEGHQPDLVACAEALGIRPEALVLPPEGDFA